MRRRRGSIYNTHLQFVAGRGTFPSAMEACHRDATSQDMDDSKLSSYRSVSNLPHLSKILESIVYRQLIGHLEEFKLLPDVQSAYRHGHSIETAVLKVYSDLIDAISNGKLALLSLLDLTAAFDTVDHAILRRHLEMTFGFHGTTLKWLSSYLESRTHLVDLDRLIHGGVVFNVPQGSVLGPLLFTLYTADIGKVMRQCGLIHHIYADDNQLYGCCLPSNSTALRAVMVRCIALVGQWMASNRLMLNPSKSEFIWFASPCRMYLIDRSPFVLPDGVVNVSSSVRNLGTFFDEGISMSDHVNRLVRSCFYHLRRIKFIRRSQRQRR